MFAANITERRGDSTVKEIDVHTKKDLFEQTMLPLSLASNELIEQDSKGLMSIQKKLWGTLKDYELACLMREAIYYEAIQEGDAMDSLVYDALLLRMDIVHFSLILSQTALESGWGTS